jgi:hypothetical protein
MRAPSKSRAAVTLLIALALPMLGCKKDAAIATGTPGEMNRDADGADPLARLASLEQEMHRLGLPVATAKEATPNLETGEERGADRDGDATLGGEGEAPVDQTFATEPQPAPSEVAADRPPQKREQAQYCSDVCDLSQAICDLEVQICSLSENHGDDPTYADACRRAGEDCDTADFQCDRCAR